jgi:hypothetical protein
LSDSLTFLLIRRTSDEGLNAAKNPVRFTGNGERTRAAAVEGVLAGAAK